jgi:hypothetical protein
MELPKLGKEDIYLFKPKGPKMNTGKAHSKRECPQRNFDVKRS